VVMDNLPSARFSPIDVRDAIVGGHRFSSQRIVSALDTKFVGYVPDDLNELIFQFDLPSRNYLSYLLPRSSHFIPPDFTTANRVHCCHVLGM